MSVTLRSASQKVLAAVRSHDEFMTKAYALQAAMNGRAKREELLPLVQEAHDAFIHAIEQRAEARSLVGQLPEDGSHATAVKNELVGDLNGVALVHHTRWTSVVGELSAASLDLALPLRHPLGESVDRQAAVVSGALTDPTLAPEKQERAELDWLKTVTPYDRVIVEQAAAPARSEVSLP